jgi:hypothetical protein
LDLDLIQVLPNTARAPKAARACQNHEKQLETESGLAAALGSIVIDTLRIVSPRNKNINRTSNATAAEVSSSTHASREFIRNREFSILFTTSPTEGNKHSR